MRRSFTSASLTVFIVITGWISTAHADPVTVWCHAALDSRGSVVTQCDNDMSGGGGGGYGHMGPDGNGQGYGLMPGHAGSIPYRTDHSMYRLVNFSSTQTLYTEDYNEAYNANAYYGMVYEQVMAHFTDAYGGIPLYRAIKGSDFLFTTSWSECNTPGWSCQGTAGYVYTYNAGGMCQLQRGYRFDTGYHFLTISNYEAGYMNGAVHIDGTIGYVYPSVMGQACPY